MLSAASPWTLVWLALACGSASFTLTKTPAFAWLRDRLPEGLLLELWNCPYCMAHWVAAILVAYVRPAPFTGVWWLDYPVCVFAVVMLATYAFQLMILAKEVMETLRAAQDRLLRDGDD